MDLIDSDNESQDEGALATLDWRVPCRHAQTTSLDLGPRCIIIVVLCLCRLITMLPTSPSPYASIWRVSHLSSRRHFGSNMQQKLHLMTPIVSSLTPVSFTILTSGVSRV